MSGCSDEIDEPGKQSVATPDGRTFSANGRPVAEAVVEAVSQVVEMDPLEMEQLYSVIDPDALEMLVGGEHGDDSLQISFEFEGRRVTVHRGGTIQVAD